MIYEEFVEIKCSTILTRIPHQELKIRSWMRVTRLRSDWIVYTRDRSNCLRIKNTELSSNHTHTLDIIMFWQQNECPEKDSSPLESKTLNKKNPSRLGSVPNATDFVCKSKSRKIERRWCFLVYKETHNTEKLVIACDSRGAQVVGVQNIT